MKFETTYTSDNQSLLEQFTEAQRYHPYIMDAAEKYNLQPSIIAGLGSRESLWGLALKPKGPAGTGDFRERKFPTPYRTGHLPPDGGFGRGLLQIDFDAHEFARGDRWKDPLENILYGCKVLAQCMGIIKRKVATGIGNAATGLAVATGHDALATAFGAAAAGYSAAAAGHDAVAAESGCAASVHDVVTIAFGAAAACTGDGASGPVNVAAGHDAVTSAFSGTAFSCVATDLAVASGPGNVAAGHDAMATGLSDREILRAALASYNAGPGRILKALREAKDIDYYTTGRNYSSDVLNRAGWFQAHGWV